jgi:hypothetical protein
MDPLTMQDSNRHEKTLGKEFFFLAKRNECEIVTFGYLFNGKV